jgi:Phage portal protein
VGIPAALRLVRSVTSDQVKPSGFPLRPQIGSPWSTGQLTAIVWADILGLDVLPPSRPEAMSVPAVARARNLLAGTVAGLPLRALRGQDLVQPQPTWLSRTDGPVSPWHRMCWTVDDILFSGWSLWAVQRDTDGFVIAADRVPPELWTWGPDGRTIVMDGQPADPTTVLLIPGPNEGILNFGGRAMREAAQLERAAANGAANPVPAVELHQTTDDTLTDAEADELRAKWAAAMVGGGVAYTNSALQVIPHGTQPEQLLITGRNAAAVNMARLTNVPAAMLDATTAGSSLTYETVAGRNAEFIDYGVALYLEPIAARLSMDDVVPRGQRVAFDLADFTSPGPGPTGPVTED